MATTKDITGKKTKYFCPNHLNNVRFLNPQVKLALCPDCLEMMIQEGQPTKKNPKKVQDKKLT